MNYLKLIRLHNLLMVIASQCIIKYGFFAQSDVQTRLDTLGFSLLILATILIAAGGYIINDIYDITADTINKPSTRIVGKSISRKRALLLYYLCTLAGLGCGIIVSIVVKKPLYSLFFLGICISLYLYSRFLKPIAIAGNILVSILVGISLFILGIFELIPVITPENGKQQLAALYLLRDIAIFAFLINFLRELVKDIEDIEGDYVAQYKTLPIVLGTKRTAKVTTVIGLIVLLLVAVYTLSFLNTTWMIALLFIGIIIPLGYVCVQLWDATSKKQFSKLSLLLKIIMLLGICTIPLFSYTLHYAI